MGEIVNLRMARKRKDRAGKEKLAQENRVRFGRTKADREADETNRAREDRTHVAHFRERTPPDDEA